MILTVSAEFPRYFLAGAGEDLGNALKPFSRGLQSATHLPDGFASLPDGIIAKANLIASAMRTYRMDLQFA